MARLIDADALKNSIDEHVYLVHHGFNETEYGCTQYGIHQIIDEAQTIDAVPTEFIMENCILDFVCDELTDDGEWCSERCQYSDPQPECIHRYIDRIWRKEHDEIH